MKLKRALATTLVTLASCALAAPAHAYPTSIWNVPTGTTAEGGNFHVGVYTYLAPVPGIGSIEDTVLLGVLPGFELGGIPGIGGLEIGADTFGSYGAFNAKLQLMGESDFLPAVAVGGLGYFNTLERSKSENVNYLSLTKDLFLGKWTVGYFMADPSVTPSGNSGWMGGVSFTLTDWLSLSAEYMQGELAESGWDVTLGFQVASNVVLSLGYLVSPLSPDANVAFLSADIDIPTGLWRSPQSEE